MKKLGGSHRPWARLIALAALPFFLSSCAFLDLVNLAGDATMGRDNATPGSALARQYIIDQLKPIASGANTALTGDAAYTQAIPQGTNVLAVIPGTDLADQYVMVGAHYDHLGSNCRTSNPNDTICNGATDNAAGDAAVLAIARAIAHQPTPPRRSILLAFWDREEDGLLGSTYYTQHPILPLAKTVAYVNFDIQGSDLRPSLRNTTFALGAESGGSVLQSTVQSAINGQTLDAVQLSAIFGQGRSDYVPFLNASVPTVFFSDATGPCYHTAQDQVGVVDFAKLDQQIAIALHVTRDLSSLSTPPQFVSSTSIVTYDDALTLARVTERLWNDRDLFSAADRAIIANGRDAIHAIVTRGRVAFGSADVGTILGDAAAVVTVLTHGVCDGFLAPSK
jgi:Zn-dependent M28 family amino/carboxypeptidase